MPEPKKIHPFEAILAEMRATVERAEALADAMERQAKNHQKVSAPSGEPVLPPEKD